MTAPAPVFAPLERCSACNTALPKEGSRTCPGCGKEKVTPRHEEWSSQLKRWLVMRLVAAQFHTWNSDQEAWERLLRAPFRGKKVSNRILSYSISADECYALAVEEAEAWTAAGSPLPWDRANDNRKVAT